MTQDARLIVERMYQTCIFAAPASLGFFLWAGTSESETDRAILGSFIAAGAWACLAIVTAVRCRSTRKRLILLALTPVACGLQVYFGLLGLTIKMGRFAP